MQHAATATHTKAATQTATATRHTTHFNTYTHYVLAVQLQNSAAAVAASRCCRNTRTHNNTHCTTLHHTRTVYLQRSCRIARRQRRHRDAAATHYNCNTLQLQLALQPHDCNCTTHCTTLQHTAPRTVCLPRSCRIVQRSTAAVAASRYCSNTLQLQHTAIATRTATATHCTTHRVLAAQLQNSAA